MENKINDEPIIETFYGKISPVDIAVLYSLMVKRISKGYSSSEMSFLMGYENDVIGNIEQLNFKELTILELYSYTNALEDDALSGIILNDMGKEHDPADYQIVKTTERILMHYEVFEILPDNTSRQLFHLFEVNPEHDRLKYNTSYSMGIETATEILNTLLGGVLFQSPESPLDIFKRCRRISTSIRPYYVQVALNNISQSKEYPKFKRIKTKKYGCLYEKAF